MFVQVNRTPEGNRTGESNDTTLTFTLPYFPPPPAREEEEEEEEKEKEEKQQHHPSVLTRDNRFYNEASRANLWGSSRMLLLARRLSLVFTDTLP